MTGYLSGHHGCTPHKNHYLTLHYCWINETAKQADKPTTPVTKEPVFTLRGRLVPQDDKRKCRNRSLHLHKPTSVNEKQQNKFILHLLQ